MPTLDLTPHPVSDITWMPLPPTRQNRNKSGRFRAHHSGSMLFDFTVSIGAMPYQEAREFDALLEGLDGTVSPFELIIPVVCIPSGQAKTVSNATPSVISGSGKVLVTGGWPANTPDLFKPGDLVRLSSPSKTYKVAQATGSNASGQCSISFTRALVKLPVGGESLFFNPHNFTVTQPVKAQEYEIPNTKQSEWELDFQEVVL